MRHISFGVYWVIWFKEKWSILVRIHFCWSRGKVYIKPAILFYKLNCKSRINISLCLLNFLYRWLKVYKIDLSKFTTMFKTYQRKNRKERQYNLFWELTDSIFYLFILYLLSNKLARYHNVDHSFALIHVVHVF